MAPFSTINSYTLGTSIEVKISLSDPDTKEPVTPPSLSLLVVAPSGPLAPNNSPGNPAIGTYTWHVVPNEPGLWNYRVTSAGALPTAEEGRFFVQPSHVI